VAVSAGGDKLEDLRASFAGGFLVGKMGGVLRGRMAKTCKPKLVGKGNKGKGKGY